MKEKNLKKKILIFYFIILFEYREPPLELVMSQIAFMKALLQGEEKWNLKTFMGFVFVVVGGGGGDSVVVNGDCNMSSFLFVIFLFSFF